MFYKGERSDIEEKRMIIMTMRGGLGNQMFEYAFARTLSLQNNGEKVYLYTGRFKYDKQREFSLKHFELSDRVMICKEPLVLKVYLKFFEKLAKIMHLDEKSFGDALRLYKFGYYEYLGRGFKEPPICKRYIKFYSTLAQNKKYFQAYEEVIRKELSVKTEPSAENCRWIEKIRNTDKSVAVHIRRGDYVNNPLYYVCDDMYFKKAVRKMTGIIPNASYFVFSEDIEYARGLKLEREANNIEYVDLQNPDYEELRLMSCCQHFIISNSTFSWWAQELAPNKDKIVISPDRWKNSDLPEDSLLIADGWILID